ncbi:MAG: glycosyltransferase, partial [Propionibacteriaceae bacterium]|nr:glycosyltransferase [Propionibacteriaceae bacterium]
MTERAVNRPSLAVCTPWYPSLGNPVLGNFVADWSRLAAGAYDVSVIHHTEWPGGPAELVAAHGPAFDALIARMGRAGKLTSRGDFGQIVRVPHALVGGWSVPERAESAVAATRRALTPLEAEVVHGHVGYFGGLVAVRLADPQARVVVTEHSSELGNVLADAKGVEIYDEVLERAAYLTCVTTGVRDLLVEKLPRHADKLLVVPNPVDFDASPRRASRPERLDRWVFVGGLAPIKGVHRLVKAFALFAADRPEARLDLFGDGPLRAELEDLVAEKGLKQRVAFHGNVPRATVLAALPRFDVLVAPSLLETFHLAVPEAVAAGLPVVVTRSGGPEEAIGETMRLCGRFVDVNDDAAELADGVRAVEADLPSLDLDLARAELAARYGVDAVRERLGELYGSPALRQGAGRPAQET